MSLFSIALGARTLAGTEPSTGASGALVVLGLILASLGLFYFMNRSLRRVPPTFEDPPAKGDAPKGDAPKGDGPSEAPDRES